MNIRQAKKTDLDSVYKLAKALATSFKVEKESFEKAFTETLKNQNMRIFVLSEDNNIVGYVMGIYHYAFYANGLVAWVEELYVAEESRGKNYGKMLMSAIENNAQKSGCKLLSLSTRRASEFYKSIGYEESATYFKKTF